MLRPRVVAVLLAPAVLLASCTADRRGPEPGKDGPSAGSGSARVDLSQVPVPRAPLCDLLPGHEATEALGRPVLRTDHYESGEEFEVTPGDVDVSHEFGCVYEGADGSAARVWVFARPVGAQEAATLVRRARRGGDCAFPDPLDFGAPGLTSVCEVRGAAGPVVRARLEGLFTDTWVGCEVTEPLATVDPEEPGDEPRPDVVQRAVSWCTAVVNAAGATGG